MRCCKTSNGADFPPFAAGNQNHAAAAFLDEYLIAQRSETGWAS